MFSISELALAILVGCTADLSLCWSLRPSCRFCRALAQVTVFSDTETNDFFFFFFFLHIGRTLRKHAYSNILKS